MSRHRRDRRVLQHARLQSHLLPGSPEPVCALKREDIQIHFFGIPDFNPEDSYGSCLVIVRDTGELYRAFAEGMRAVRGKLLVSGISRMTRPRKRKNADNHSGFAVIDPGGNWIRINAAKPEPDATEAVQSKLAKSLQSALVMGDSHGYDVRAAQILDAALERYKDMASATDLLEALAYRTELALRMDDTAAASGALTRARSIALSGGERDSSPRRWSASKTWRPPSSPQSDRDLRSVSVS